MLTVLKSMQNSTEVNLKKKKKNWKMYQKLQHITLQSPTEMNPIEAIAFIHFHTN